MIDPHCRIGNIRAKNGAVLRLLPSLAERNAEEAWDALDTKIRRARELYPGSLDGFICIMWDGEGLWSCWYRDGRMQHGNSLPDFARGAVARQLAYAEAAQAIEDTLRNR